MKKLIKELEELQSTLKADGYKDWCYAQLTVNKAIKVIKNCNLAGVSGTVCPNCGCNKYVKDAELPNKCINCDAYF